MSAIEQKTINTIRTLSADMIQKAKSGHPGLPLGVAPMAYTLWAKQLKHSPKNPEWVDRDRFVLSAGHGSALMYSLLHLFNYGLTMDDIKNFRQLGSLTPGHPEYKVTKGVEISTGPLGQGIANAVGFAMAEARLAAEFNREGHEIVDHYTYAICGDGCMMEGVSGEAASLAGNLGLGKLIVIYDSNSITIEGDTSITFSEDVCARFEAYGWQTISVEDGTDIEAINKAIEQAKSEKSKPTLIKVTTVIGYGSPRAGSSKSHGEPLGEDNVKALKETLGMPAEDFFVADDVYEHMNGIVESLNNNEEEWNKKFEAYKNAYPELAEEWSKWMSGDFDMSYLDSDEFWSFDDKPTATRAASGTILNRLTKIIPNLIGGSADLGPSNKSIMDEAGEFSKENYTGSNLHFGVRELAMGAICNAIAAHGGLTPYCASFFVFSDYAKPAMRMSALMKLPVTYIYTHDSIGVGEDGPTHQPIEHLVAVRSTPDFVDFRPADSVETAAGWYHAVKNKEVPTALVLTRQNVNQLKGTGKDALKGAYTLKDSEKETPDIILIASGSEVELVYNAHEILKNQGIDARVVSMPSMALFEKQDKAYKESVLPSACRARLAVEAATSFGWHRYIGLDGDIMCIDSFGVSAPASKLFEKFGFTVDNVVARAKALLNK